jgi:hypothetical protein
MLSFAEKIQSSTENHQKFGKFSTSATYSSVQMAQAGFEPATLGL